MGWWLLPTGQGEEAPMPGPSQRWENPPPPPRRSGTDGCPRQWANASKPLLVSIKPTPSPPHRPHIIADMPVLVPVQCSHHWNPVSTPEPSTGSFTPCPLPWRLPCNPSLHISLKDGYACWCKGPKGLPLSVDQICTPNLARGKRNCRDLQGSLQAHRAPASGHSAARHSAWLQSGPSRGLFLMLPP